MNTEDFENLDEAYQGICVFDGTGVPLFLTDTMTYSELKQYVDAPASAYVTLKRLSYWAEIYNKLAAELLKKELNDE